ncbi:MAG: hypothetical protein ACLR4W_07350 [Oscillospiraceae bacterium]
MTRLTRAVWVPPSTVIAPSGTATVARSPTACSGRRMSQPSRRMPPSQRCAGRKLRQPVSWAALCVAGWRTSVSMSVTEEETPFSITQTFWQLRQHSPGRG